MLGDNDCALCCPDCADGECEGRWKGAFVAIKIVDHKEAANKVLALREGTLSHSAQHPNVVSTHTKVPRNLMDHL